MSKEKNKQVEQPTELSGKEMRRKAYEARMAQQAPIEDSREEFRKYFVELKRKLNLAPEIESVMWEHFKAVGMDKKDKFNEGVKHFGYKI